MYSIHFEEIMIKFFAELLARFAGLGQMPASLSLDSQIVDIPAAVDASEEYVDAGVFYFYDNPVCFTGHMDRVEGKATEGTYRCDGRGKYFFSKKDKGTPVIILFTFDGKLERRTVTI